MNWKEIRKKTGDVLPSLMNEKNGWPTPDVADFWHGVAWNDEIEPFINDQVRRRAGMQETRAALVAAYKMIASGDVGYPTASEADTIFSENRDFLLDDATLTQLLEGSMSSVFLSKLGIKVWQLRGRTTEEVLEEDTTPDQVGKLPLGLRETGWWGLFLSSKDKHRCVRAMNKIGLRPPEVI